MVRFSHWKKIVEQRGRRASRFAHLETAARAGDGGAVQAGLRESWASSSGALAPGTLPVMAVGRGVAHPEVSSAWEAGQE
jgi:hypothetical protein